PNQILLQIQQLIKHPKQPHLHHPNQTQPLFFHQPKALSHFHKPYPTPSQLPHFNLHPIPYQHSLQHPITHLHNQLKKHNTHYSPFSLNNLNPLKQHYPIQYKRHFH
uniref:sporulation phosphorelay system protein KapB n=1 Tax=Staphylococcus epidermidis TaxID=1282 RepID=UPI0011AA8E97